MGVQFVCNNTEWCQSYSGLQQERQKWIAATVEYLKQLKLVEDPEAESDYEEICFNSEMAVVKQLEKSLQATTLLMGLCYVNYGEFEGVNRDSLRFFGLIGLHLFVKHSDCEGYYCPGEAMEMLATFKKIEPFMKMDDDSKEYYQDLIKLLQESVNTQTNIKLT